MFGSAGCHPQITINDLPVGRSVDETLRLIKAFQFTDEHGGEGGRHMIIPCKILSIC
jgi:alkyl hydroperoxide reductase subunit AhpC